MGAPSLSSAASAMSWVEPVSVRARSSMRGSGSSVEEKGLLAMEKGFMWEMLRGEVPLGKGRER